MIGLREQVTLTPTLVAGCHIGGWLRTHRAVATANDGKVLQVVADTAAVAGLACERRRNAKR